MLVKSHLKFPVKVSLGTPDELYCHYKPVKKAVSC